MSVVPFVKSLLQVRDLVVSLDDGTAVVEDIAFSVAPGEIIGVVGESGSGKSSIASALLGDARAGAVISGGSVFVEGRDLLSLDEPERRQMRGPVISHVAQDPALALNPMRRIGSLLEEVLRVHQPGLSRGEWRQRIAEAAADVGLPADAEFLRRFPHQLSGGQQQRVLLALAVVLRPRLIVLDEPTTALDVSTQAKVLATVRELCRTREIGAVYVSHDLAVVRELVDRVVVLYAGRIVESGSRDQVFGAPTHPYTRGLLDAVPDISGRHVLRAISGHAPALHDRGEGCAFGSRCDLRSASCKARPPLRDFGERRLAACHHPVRGNREDVTANVRTPAALSESGAERPERRMLAVLEEVTASYGANQVLADVNLSLREGYCTALVGESGSGKTTFARSLVGAVEDVDGVFFYDGRPLDLAGDRDKDLRRRIQYIFQNPFRALNPRQTVGQILRTAALHFFPIRSADADKEVAEVLRRVALAPELAQRHPRDLSGGERQRVAIARALICKPQLLICDEITSALDVSVQAAIIDLLRSLQRESGLTILFVTHDLGVVRAVSDYVAVLRQGRIVEQGLTAHVLDEPQHDYTRGLVADSPRLRDTAA
ncbi:dipeptide ABC transporter ATP-binding protein [Novosphingobium sp. ZW T3_23]|uniref:dipeptide ABC transporter ATP-binding protein n=1 Tax=Novosphingobium sp. ZW T3_23 TaxID=3378084 RepID=UPI003851C85B